MDLRRNDINIREARADDIDALVAFQQEMAKETEGKDLNADLLRRGVQAVFLSPDKGYYTVAQYQGKVVAGLLITYEWSDWRHAIFLWIQSVYVNRQYRRQGIYKALHNYLYRIASERKDICGIRLYVDHENTVAQQTYASLGMTKTHYDMYEIDFVL